VAAAVIGPPLARDWARPLPKDLPMAAAGAGLLWLDWNGFNGGGQPRPTPPHPTHDATIASGPAAAPGQARRR
jgi:ammonia channel protein AmtB